MWRTITTTLEVCPLSLGLVPTLKLWFFAALLEKEKVEQALDGFAEVVSMEAEKGEWGFRALKQIVKLQFKLGKHTEMMNSYHQLLTYIRSGVTRNYSEKVLSSILDIVSCSTNTDFLQDFYETTLLSLEAARNERLWFKTNLKLCKLWFAKSEFGHVGKMLKDMYKVCQHADGSADQRKGTQLLEVYAVEIQMYTEQKNNKKLKELYQRALAITSAIPHPHILGVIRECGGKMHMTERNWEAAATDFFEAFKSFDEAGQPRRIQCLKYLVLANMLMESEVNPFDAHEARPFKLDPDILIITSLVAAYQRNSIVEFESLLKAHHAHISGDPFLRDYVDDLLKNIRTQVLMKLIMPFTRVCVPFISVKLNIPEDEVNALLVSLILDSRIGAQVDQVGKVVELNTGFIQKNATHSHGLERWARCTKAKFHLQHFQ